MESVKNKAEKRSTRPVQVQVETEDHSDEYEVDAIRAKRIVNGTKVEYFVKWQHWPEHTNTWEPAEHLEGSEELVQDFELKEYMEEYNATVGPTNGFSMGREFRAIKGAVDWGSDQPGELRRNIHYAIQWEDSDSLELIPSSVVRREKPAEVIAYLESLINTSK